MENLERNIFRKENLLEKSSSERLNDPRVVTVFLNRHGKYENSFPREEKFNAETAGRITPEGKEQIREQYLNFFNQVVRETKSDLPIDIMVLHSPTRWLDYYGQRATETADILIEVAKEFLEASDRDIQIQSDLGIKIRKGILVKGFHDKAELSPKKGEILSQEDAWVADYREKRDAILEESRKVENSSGEKTPITRLREGDIFWPYKDHQGDLRVDQAEYIKALRKKYPNNFWEKYYEGAEDLETERKKVGAESAKDIANRTVVVMRGISRYQNKIHGVKHPERKLIVCAITHGEVISSFMRQGVGVEKEQGGDFGFNEGVRVDVLENESRILSTQGKEYELDLKLQKI
ncbi:MAG TPA: hypothetical protein VF817_03190 [Patescibacteria group bacterium]